jgi:aminoglycoside phosphotransferase (APT) family kinase protein
VEHNYLRGGPLAVFDEQARAAILALRGRIDGSGLLDVWDAALAATWDGHQVWVAATRS